MEKYYPFFREKPDEPVPIFARLIEQISAQLLPFLSPADKILIRLSGFSSALNRRSDKDPTETTFPEGAADSTANN